MLPGREREPLGLDKLLLLRGQQENTLVGRTEAKMRGRDGVYHEPWWIGSDGWIDGLGGIHWENDLMLEKKDTLPNHLLSNLPKHANPRTYETTIPTRPAISRLVANDFYSRLWCCDR